MKVLQLIDSLEMGGAERVAVNLANELSGKIEKSYLCVTRKEGGLKNSLNPTVDYLYLKKTSKIDFKAIRGLNTFIKKNKIDIIHAHSSSFFLAVIIKLLNKSIKVIWHDHYGNSDFLEKRKTLVLKLCSVYFSYIFSVNRHLYNWAVKKLHTKHVSYLPNFAVKVENKAITSLHGENRKRVICLANLRAQKDHLNLIKAFKNVVETHSDWSLHIVGKDFNDACSNAIKKAMLDYNLKNNIFLYGSREDTFHILEQSEIAVLPSKSEGLPLALLEYGLAKLPVICTKVGECETVVKSEKFGILIEPEHSIELTKAINALIVNKEKRESIAKAFHLRVKEKFSAEANLDAILKVYKQSII